MQTFWLVSTPTRWVLWGAVQTALLLPVIAYAYWMLTIAIRLQQWTSFGLITGVILILVATGAGLNDYRLRHPSPDSFPLTIFHDQITLRAVLPDLLASA